MAEQDGKKELLASKLSESKYRKTVSYVLSFILSLLLVLFTLCIVAQVSLFSESTFIGLLGNDYYQGVYDQIVSAAEDTTIPTGIDISVIDGVFTLEEVKKDVNGYISAAFNGEDYTPDTEASDNRLYINVSEFLDNHDVTLLTDKKETINDYIAEVNAEYAEYARMPGLSLILRLRTKYQKIITISGVILLALSVIIGAIIIKLYRHPHRGMRYLAYASGGAALMSLCVPLWLLISRAYKGLNLSPQYFYDFILSYITNALVICIVAAAIWLLITVGIALAIHFIRVRLIKKNS